MKKYIHRFYTHITCQVIDTTAKGYKVLQAENGKTKTAFYAKVDFCPKKGLWVEVKEEEDEE